MNEGVAWAAGLFEGEGSISFNNNGGSRALPVIQLSMTDEDVVQRFAAIVGAGSVRRQLQGRFKTRWTWRIVKWSELERILLLFRPYMGERRRRRCDEALASPPVNGQKLRLHCSLPALPSGAGAALHRYYGQAPCERCRESQSLAAARYYDLKKRAA